MIFVLFSVPLKGPVFKFSSRDSRVLKLRKVMIFWKMCPNMFRNETEMIICSFETSNKHIYVFFTFQEVGWP